MNAALEVLFDTGVGTKSSRSWRQVGGLGWPRASVDGNRRKPQLEQTARLWVLMSAQVRDTYRSSCNGPLASGAENLRYAGDGWSGSETRIGGEQWAVQCLRESDVASV